MSGHPPKSLWATFRGRQVCPENNQEIEKASFKQHLCTQSQPWKNDSSVRLTRFPRANRDKEWLRGLNDAFFLMEIVRNLLQSEDT
ncbi:hypothetical protein BI308_01805 [Roseofilum reptotaenium AO1-A]|uniref:Uncharacterized protein n=1 Tax=Roseofilum reptotaenium AO1-A TaxID=1925591 RepID=A0A1L9QX96_9CYAN|nr:hypothetical protein BI308_01805 [Roseofilum reptotaenium AO1-A]